MSNAEAQRRWRERNPEKCRAATKAWAEKNRDYVRERAREYRARNKDKVLGWKVKRYGITAERYQELMDAQGGVCAICGKTCAKWQRLSVDHHHETQAVRGLLCDNCNTGLGKFVDDPSLLRAAADYLEKPR